MSKWIAVKKEPGDFAMTFPWKATNGAVCSDHKTEKQAEKACKEANKRDSKGKLDERQ